MAIQEINQLKTFSFDKQLAFAYLSCERVCPNYVFFSNNYKFGNPDVLKSAINFVYDSMFNVIDNEKKDELLQLIQINAPRPDNFATFYATIAMNAAGVIYESVNLLNRIDCTRILGDISTMCTDAVDLFIQERDDMDYEDKNFEETIANDILMQQECSIQKGTITYLSQIKTLDKSDIEILLQLQKTATGTLC